jgi:hypothetical protein
MAARPSSRPSKPHFDVADRILLTKRPPFHSEIVGIGWLQSGWFVEMARNVSYGITAEGFVEDRGTLQYDGGPTLLGPAGHDGPRQAGCTEKGH